MQRHRRGESPSVDEYAGRFPLEAAEVKRMREFVLANDNCFERELEHGHMTGSAWLVDLKGERVLLTHHKKLNGWFQLGGHADGNHDILEVALTEAREESGITNVAPVSGQIFDIDIHCIPQHKNVQSHYHYDVCFVFQVVDSEEYVVSDESNDLAWADTSQIENYSTSDSMLRMAEKWNQIAANARILT